MNSGRWTLAAAMVLLATWACDSPTIPIPRDARAYDFRVQVLDSTGANTDRTFHWKTGSTVFIHIPATASTGRPPLDEALRHAISAWAGSAILNELRIETTEDPAKAHAVLAWADDEPILSSTLDCAGPTTGAASTRGCFNEDRTGLVAWGLRDGRDSRVLFSVTVRYTIAMDDLRLRRLVAHEVGHVLGILNHSPNADDLMWPGVLVTDVPSPADRLTLRTLYQTRSDLNF